MSKLTVKNVGPIREAELEVKKHTVFIGPQGTGKSTLAKLIAIGSDEDVLPSPLNQTDLLFSKYNLDGYAGKTSYYAYKSLEYEFAYRNRFALKLTNYGKELLNKKRVKGITFQAIPDFETYQQNIENWLWTKPETNPFPDNPQLLNYIITFYKNFLRDEIIKINTSYVPAERSLFPILSNAVWSLLSFDVNLPKSITHFGRSFEEARNTQLILSIPFLNIKYKRNNGQDFVEYIPEQLINFAQSASGYQSIIPLLLVVEYQRQQSRHRFIIEEPELNLYPTAQKDLIYNLMGGLQPDVTYQDAEWVITTHSPYVLSSFNTLMLAYKVAQRSEELRAEVEKIIPAKCWINPDDFAAYYVGNATVRSIISEKTGLIADNELDDVSEDLAGEQDQLLELSRSVPRA